MKPLILASLAATTTACLALAAQSTGGQSGGDNAVKSAAPDAKPAFIQNEAMGLMRAPKLIGVVVYDQNNKTVGKIDDILIDHSGEAQVAVIGAGGFLGIGRKDVALPFTAIRWKTEPHKVEAPAPANGALGQTNGAPAKLPIRVIDPAAAEAYQGYPDRAEIEVSQAQIKSAPEFKYAPSPMTEAAPPRPAAGAPPIAKTQ